MCERIYCVPHRIRLHLARPLHHGSLSSTVSGSCGKHPPIAPTLGDGSECRRGKGLKTVCIAPRCTSDTFHRMNLIDKELKPSSTIFHGVVPGKSAYPAGNIALEVAFGDD